MQLNERYLYNNEEQKTECRNMQEGGKSSSERQGQRVVVISLLIHLLTSLAVRLLRLLVWVPSPFPVPAAVRSW